MTCYKSDHKEAHPLKLLIIVRVPVVRMMQCLVHLVRMASLECTQNFELNLENFPSNVGKICQDKRMITVE